MKHTWEFFAAMRTAFAAYLDKVKIKPEQVTLRDRMVFQAGFAAGYEYRQDEAKLVREAS